MQSPESFESTDATDDAPRHESSPGAHRGARLATIVALLCGIGLAALITVRVKEAIAKKHEVAEERVNVQSALQKKAPSRAVQPVSMRWKPQVEVTGTLRPWRDADVGFELGGRLTSIVVRAGDVVKAGSSLAILDSSRATEQVSQAEAASRAALASHALAADNLRRTEALALTKSIPEAQVEQARQQLALAKAQLEGAQATTNLARTGAGLHTILAPFAGVVTRAPTAAGGVVQPGAPLVHIEDLSRFRLSASISEEDTDLTKVGAPVVIEYHDKKVMGRVITLVPSLDQATRRAPIEVEVPNDPKAPILAWSFVHALIEGGNEVDALRVPANARKPGSQDEVVKLVGGKAQVVHVIHAVDTDGSWIVRQGLSKSDTLIVDPSPDTATGDPIELVTDTAASPSK